MTNSSGKNKITKVLFVCLGNICRSPAAEAVFLGLVKDQGLEERFEADSAGTSAYHAGDGADERMIEQARKRNIQVPSVSRQFLANDFKKFDIIVVMDDSNYENVLKLDPTKEHASKVVKLTDFASEKYSDFSHVPDPYFGGMDGFDLVLDLLEDCCSNLLKSLNS